jgi:hypothetical protein
MTYTLDSLHPHWLRCDHCGQPFGPVGLAGDNVAVLVSITEDFVSAWFRRPPGQISDPGGTGPTFPAATCRRPRHGRRSLRLPRPPIPGELLPITPRGPH